MSNNVNGNKESDNGSSSEKDNIVFYYNREERLKKLKALIDKKKRPGIFKKGGKRTLLVILIDIVIVSLFIYFLNRPTNLYQKKDANNIQYELNITGIKGKKVMFALTITNKSNTNIEISMKKQVTLRIISSDKNKYDYKKLIGEDTVLHPGESTSVVFMLRENELPKSGIVNIYVGDNVKPVFSQKVRFYYFNL